MSPRKNTRARKRTTAASSRSFRALGVLAILGAAVSAYLTVVHFQHLADPAHGSVCNFEGWLDCDAVNTSEYSELLGVPVAFLGVLFYALVAVLSFHTGAREDRRAAAAGYLRLLGFIGVATAAVLAVISVAIISAFCLFCVGLYAINLLLLILAYRLPGKRVSWYRTLNGDLGSLVRQRRRLVSVVIALAIVVGLTLLVRHFGHGFRSAAVEGTRIRLPTGAHEIGAVEGQVFGSKDADVTVLLFSDFECPFCPKASATFDRLIERFEGRARFVFKHFPLHPSCNPASKKGKHEHACRAARAAVCAAAEGRFAAFHGAVFDVGAADSGLRKAANRAGIDPDELLRCAESLRSGLLVEADVQDGIRLGVKSTPTFVVGDRLLTGAKKLEALTELVEEALETAGQPRR